MNEVAFLEPLEEEGDKESGGEDNLQLEGKD